MTALDTRYSWQPLPGPELARVMLCGWQEGHGGVRGYWWYEEGQTDEKGWAFHRPGASHWCPIIIPPFPEIAAAIEWARKKKDAGNG